jgi:hypothetical protein
MEGTGRGNVRQRESISEGGRAGMTAGAQRGDLMLRPTSCCVCTQRKVMTWPMEGVGGAADDARSCVTPRRLVVVRRLTYSVSGALCGLRRSLSTCLPHTTVTKATPPSAADRWPALHHRTKMARNSLHVIGIRRDTSYSPQGTLSVIQRSLLRRLPS